jgi:DNA-binding HxlR family transcriptional regulator
MPKSSSSKSSRRSACPVACTLDLLGDRWTLLIIRDLLTGKSRYGEFLESAEGITTNILAERLKRLESAGIIASATYQENPPRYAYSLTRKGDELKSVLGAVAQWGMRHVANVKPHPILASYLDRSGR